MGIIHEKLTLVDNFSSAFNKFIKMAAGGATGAEKLAAGAKVAEEAAKGASVSAGNLGQSLDEVAAGAVQVVEPLTAMADATKLRLKTLNESLEKQVEATKKLQNAYVSLTKDEGNATKAALKLRKQIEDSQKSEYRYSIEIAKTIDALKKVSIQEQLDTVNIQKKTDALNKATRSLQNYGTEAAESVKEIGDASKQAAAGSNTLTTSLKRLIAAAGGLTVLKKVIDLSDSITQTSARLNLMNDGNQTTAELYDSIYKAAQRSRTSVDSFADTVAKMGMNAGQAFSSNAEMIQVMENIAKQFAIGGATAEEQKSAMVQLTQAMAAGALRGEELNSILDSAPGIARNIEKSMGWATGSIKQYAEEGLVTADVVKNAMLESTEEINEQFNSMPMTFSQATTLLKNVAQKAFTPIGEYLSDAINTDEFQSGLEEAGEVIYGFTNLASKGFEMLGSMAHAASENMYWIAPVVGTVAVAFAAYIVVVKGAAAAHAIYNAALAASPLTWVVVTLALVAAALAYATAQWIHFSDTGNTALGIVVGAVYGAGSVIVNVLKTIGNFFITVGEVAVNTWNYWVYMAKMGIYDFKVGAINGWNDVMNGASTAATAIANCFIEGANLAIKGINWIIEALNKIPGVDLNTIGEMSKRSVSVGTQLSVDSIPKPTFTETTFDKYDTTSTADAWASGFEKGADIGDDWSNNISDAWNNLTSGYDGLGNAMDEQTSAYDSMYNSLNDAADANDKTNVGSVDKVKSVESDISLADEDVKMFRDLAERKYINKIELKTVQPKISVTQNNTGNGGSDAKSLAEELAKILDEQSSECGDVVYV